MGMEANPTPVGIQAASATGRRDVLLTANLQALTMALMVAPRSMTLANTCHRSVSNAFTAVAISWDLGCVAAKDVRVAGLYEYHVS